MSPSLSPVKIIPSGHNKVNQLQDLGLPYGHFVFLISSREAYNGVANFLKHLADRLRMTSCTPILPWLNKCGPKSFWP